jgi:hypothetical protein
MMICFNKRQSLMLDTFGDNDGRKKLCGYTGRGYCMIPKNITREHIFRALEKIDSGGIPKGRESTIYNLVYNDKYYPPKLVISLANIYANGEELLPCYFSGGQETNNYLNQLGFMIIPHRNGTSTTT